MIINSMEMFQITVPLLVLERCPTPAHLSTWVALSWFHACFRGQPLTDAQIAHRAGVAEETVPQLITDLMDHHLLRGDLEAGRYVPAWLTAGMESARTASTIIEAWAATFPTPPVPTQTSFFLRDDDPAPDARGEPASEPATEGCIRADADAHAHDNDDEE